MIEHEDDRSNNSNLIEKSSLSDSDGSENDLETENDDDLAKFLGLAKSPMVQQALIMLGFNTPHQNNVTSNRKRNNADSELSTPTSARFKGETTSSSLASNSSKIRLTYEGDNKQKEDVYDNDESINCKRLKMSPEENEKKVPPLKISLKTQVLQHEGNNVDPISQKKVDEFSSLEVSDSLSSSESSIKPQLPPQEPFVPGITFAPIDKFRKLRTSASVAVVLPQKRGQESIKEGELHQPITAASEEPLSEETLSHENLPISREKSIEQPQRTTSEDNNSVVKTIEKRSPRKRVVENSTAFQTIEKPSPRKQRGLGPPPSSANSVDVQKSYKKPLNYMEKYLEIRRTVEEKHKHLFDSTVQPKPPEGFKDYLMNKKTYLLQGNANERLRSMPMVQPPSSLKGPLRELFVDQEKERFKLRTKHIVEKEKLVLAVEQVSHCFSVYKRLK